MTIDIVMGMQFGSEAKGSAVSHILKDSKYAFSMRVQSTQAGHTVYYKDVPYKMQSIPCAWVDPNVRLLLGPGCFTERALLMREIESINAAMGGDVRDRLAVDKRVFEVTEDDKKAEETARLSATMGSTAHGCGSSLVRKMWRATSNGDFINWCFDNKIKVIDTVDAVNGKRDDAVLVEGCQGAMLALHTSPYYPYVTTRESTVSGILSECGISPFSMRDIYGVFRTLPIRVGGNSGPTGGAELTWEEVSERAEYDVAPEKTTVTKRIRRIFEFSVDDMRHAMRVNTPTRLMMTFANYLTPCYGVTEWKDLLPESQNAISKFTNTVNGLSRDYGVGGTVISFNTGELDKHWINI